MLKAKRKWSVRRKVRSCWKKSGRTEQWWTNLKRHNSTSLALKIINSLRSYKLQTTYPEKSGLIGNTVLRFVHFSTFLPRLSSPPRDAIVQHQIWREI